MYKRILLPVDLGDPNLAKPAVETAVMFANANNSTVRLINVLPVTPALLSEYVPADFDDQQRRAAEDALAIIAAEIKLAPGRVSYAVRQGGTYQEILHEAEECGADLIVMSSHRTGARTYFLGSVAGHVVRYATCSVMVVRR